MEHLKTQWETPKNQQNINRISPRINGHFQKSIETWNIQKKNADQKIHRNFHGKSPKIDFPAHPDYEAAANPKTATRWTRPQPAPR
jgi:hypothetical protein